MPRSCVPTIDEGVLTELTESTGGDIGFVVELVETYLADTPAQLEAMASAVAADDADALVRPAHTLKSSSATVGAMRLSSVARELEMAGRTGTLDGSVPWAPGRRPRGMERGRRGIRRVARGSIGAMTANGTALVVDDSAVNRLVLVRRLETLGLEVIQAENGRQALEMLAKEPGRVDVVLLDVLMPELDGYETLAAMKADDETRHIPVLIVSGVDELDSVVRCIELGASDYLPKPINASILAARINASLAAKRLHDVEQALNRTIERQKEELSRFLSPQVAALVSHLMANSCWRDIGARSPSRSATCAASRPLPSGRIRRS